MRWISEFEPKASTKVRKQILATLPFNTGFILVEGCNGCGKSSLKQRLERELANSCTIVNLPYSRLDTDQLFAALITLLEIDIGQQSPEQALIAFAFTCNVRGRPLCLLIDDIQFMPADALSSLTKLGVTELNDQPAIGGVVFAPDGFGESLGLYQAGFGLQYFTMNFTLTAPEVSEQREFIGHLLAQTPEAELTEDGLQYLIDNAGDHLQRIKQLTGAATLEVAITQSETLIRRPLDRGELQQRLFAAGLISAEALVPNVMPLAIKNHSPKWRTVAAILLITNATTLVGFSLTRDTTMNPDNPSHWDKWLQINITVPWNEWARENKLQRWVETSWSKTGALLGEFNQHSGLQFSSATAADAPQSQPISAEHNTANAEALPTKNVTENNDQAIDAIDHLLALARADELAFRYTYPQGNNAVTHYRQVLQLDPISQGAIAGLNRIEQLYRQRALQALENQEWQLARQNYQRLLWINQGHPWAKKSLAQLPRE